MHLRHSHDRSQMDGHVGLGSWVLCGESRVKNLQGQEPEKPKRVEGIDNRWVKVMDHGF